MQRLKRFGGWIGNQFDAFLRGIMGLASTSPKAWLPVGIWGVITWAVRSTTWAVGTSTPTKQISASVALAGFALLTSWITLGATLILVVFFVGTAGVGVLRLIPVVNEWFVSIRGTVVPRA